jgi:hypothetical protein
LSVVIACVASLNCAMNCMSGRENRCTEPARLAFGSPVRATAMAAAEASTALQPESIFTTLVVL